MTAEAMATQTAIECHQWLYLVALNRLVFNYSLNAIYMCAGFAATLQPHVATLKAPASSRSLQRPTLLHAR